jgi:adenosylmethionine-8-amino-7-oxononanoate aminotransferase
MSNVFPRNCKANLPLAVQGDGVYIIDSNGKRYIDASGGAAVSCLGHSNSRVVDAIKAQLERLAFAHTGFFSSVPAESPGSSLTTAIPSARWPRAAICGGVNRSRR